MAVVIETTLGDITVDLYLEQRPVTCLNFLKLCKMKYYNYNLFHTIRSGFIAQTGDPSGEGSGGQSIWGILEGPHKRFFSGEKMPKIRHTDAGLLSMVCTDDMMVGSQFFITLAPDLDSLDGTHCVIGEVTEGHDVLTKLNEVICDEAHRPYRDVRITHTVVLDDPFNDPPGLRAPSRSPSPNPERLKGGRIAPDEEIDETQGKSAEEIQEMIEEKEAKARATILEIVGDLPDAEIAPPENVLFVCKLNPVTTDEDLEIIFSRFGKIVSCEVIRDKKTNNSLQYAFIEFENKKACEDAYFKMDNVLIDDRRIHVDFSQSVSKMRWLGKGRGVQYFDDDSKMSQPREQKNRDRDNYQDRRHKEDYASRNRYENNERKRDRDHQHERERDTDRRNNRDRSRSRLEYSHSRPSEKDRDRDLNNDNRERNKRPSERERDRYSKDDKREKDNRPSERNRDRYVIDDRKEKDNKYNSRYEDHKNNHSNSHKSNSSNYNDEENRSRRSPKKYDKTDNKTHSNSNHKNRDEYERNKQNHENYRIRMLRKEHKENDTNDFMEPKTPSPTIIKKKVKDPKKNNRKSNAGKKLDKKKKEKKRKPSTSSSDSDSSETSSSSSQSSSSSCGKGKKKKSKNRKRKYSTSSSSTESSSSSSSSSDSSDSDGKHSKKKHQNLSRKISRKTKKL